ncbi:MAG: DUF448 domain-containing protein, partial [Magnetococcales bacterium]|nr:DUF448 domain-containing protein [Magnetococcales bacterium]
MAERSGRRGRGSKTAANGASKRSNRAAARSNRPAARSNRPAARRVGRGSEPDGRVGTQRNGSTRQCAVTRALKPKSELLRFVVGPDGTPVADVAGRLPGRGIHVRPERQNVAAFLAGRIRMRRPKGLQLPVADQDAALALVGEQLTRRLVEAIGLARRSGGS